MKPGRWWRGETVEYTPEEMRRFRTGDPQFGDLPDEVVRGLMVFQWWLFGQRVRELGREIVRAAREDRDRIAARLRRIG